MSQQEPLEEPDVTPLINVNLVILVMVLAIASHAARLLILSVPKAKGETTFIEMPQAAVLEIDKDGRYAFQGKKGLGIEELAREIEDLPEDKEVLLVSPHPKAKYQAMVRVIDLLIGRGDLPIAFGYPGQADVGKSPTVIKPPEAKTPAPAKE